LGASSENTDASGSWPNAVSCPASSGTTYGRIYGMLIRSLSKHPGA
jgi:hypothetical protein